MNEVSKNIFTCQHANTMAISDSHVTTMKKYLGETDVSVMQYLASMNTAESIIDFIYAHHYMYNSNRVNLHQKINDLYI